MSVLNKIRRPLLMSGLVLLMAGGATLIFNRGHGRIRLVTGISESRLVLADGSDTSMLAFSLVLDSIRADAVIPEYKILVWAADTAARSHSGTSTAFSGLVDEFEPDTMVIRQVGESDYRFRVVELYPDFTFRYTYDADKSTTPPAAPGVTLDLRSPAGSQIATLRADQPGKHTLDDHAGLGCVFEYHWMLDADSLARELLHTDQPINKVFFSGADNRVYFLVDGKLSEDALEENRRYTLDDNKDKGFTVLVHFPDAAYLKAVPATASADFNKPVARVEIWRKGGGAQEIFLYPNTNGRIGGDHRVKGTNAVLTLGESPKALLGRSDVYMRAGPQEEEAHALVLDGGKGVVFSGKHIKPLSCHAEYPGSVVLSVRSLTGFWIACAGMLAVVLALASGLSAGPRHEKDQRPA
jgi:hypothetical protein